MNMRGVEGLTDRLGPPFPVGVPVGRADLVDREDLIVELVGRLASGQSILLAGPRRTGKSGIGLEVLRRLGDDRVYTAAVDLFRVTSEEELAVRLLTSILANRTGSWAKASRSLGALREALSGVRVSAKIHDLELALALSPSTLTPPEALEVAIETGERMALRDHRRLVVLLDEFQEVERIGGQDLVRRLRALMQSQRATAYLFLGSRPSLLRSLFAHRQGAFYRFAVPMDIPPVPEDEWRGYLTRKLRAYGVEITAAALARLLDHTDGHPWCTMEVVSEAWIVRGHPSQIDAEDVERGYVRALERLTPLYEGAWQEVRRVRHADGVLKRIVLGEPVFDRSLNPGSVTRALRHLLEIAVLERGAGRGDYRLVEKMFGDWVRDYT